jgi:hypothetical protein
VSSHKVRLVVVGSSNLYDREKYAAKLREGFEPFEQFAATPRSGPDSLDSDLADDLSLSSFRRFEIPASRRISPHASGFH